MSPVANERGASIASFSAQCAAALDAAARKEDAFTTPTRRSRWPRSPRSATPRSTSVAPLQTAQIPAVRLIPGYLPLHHCRAIPSHSWTPPPPIIVILLWYIIHYDSLQVPIAPEPEGGHLIITSSGELDAAHAAAFPALCFLDLYGTPVASAMIEDPSTIAPAVNAFLNALEGRGCTIRIECREPEDDM